MCPLIICLVIVIISLCVPAAYMMGITRGVVIERKKAAAVPLPQGTIIGGAAPLV